MRPSWILSEEERARRFQGRSSVGRGSKSSSRVQSPTDLQMEVDRVITVKQEVEEEQKAPLSCNIESNGKIEGGLAELDVTRVLQYGLLMRTCCSTSQSNLPPRLVTELVATVQQPGATLSPEVAVQLHNLLDQRTRCFISLLPEFSSLPPSDKVAMLESNLPLVHRFRQAVALAATMVGYLAWQDLDIFTAGPRVRCGLWEAPHSRGRGSVYMASNSG